MQKVNCTLYHKGTEAQSNPFDRDVLVSSCLGGEAWQDTKQIPKVSVAKGLVKFDGVNWTVYNTDNSGLSDNHVRVLATDAQANLWIGTQEGGLAVYREDGVILPGITTAVSPASWGQIKAMFR